MRATAFAAIQLVLAGVLGSAALDTVSAEGAVVLGRMLLQEGEGEGEAAPPPEEGDGEGEGEAAAPPVEGEGEGEAVEPVEAEGEGEGTTPPAEEEGEVEGSTPPAEEEGEGEDATPPAEGEDEGEAAEPVEAEGEGEGAEPPAEGEGEGEAAEPPAEGESEGDGAEEAEAEGTAPVEAEGIEEVEAEGAAPVEAEGEGAAVEGEGAAPAAAEGEGEVEGTAPAGAAGDPSTAYTEEIAEGLVYFQGLAATARPKVVALRDAVVAGDVEAAKTAYINSRNEYEQIEVLAPGFGDVDCSIDCRANAYDHGEGTSGTPVIGLDEFQGFHRIENLLYRDGVTAPAVPYAEGLVTLWDHLEEALAMPANFDFCGWFEGVIGLSGEVAAKKISSEEETYSDQSILIFYNNFEGIEQAVLPFMPTYMAADPDGATALEAAFVTADESIAPYVNEDGTFAPYSGVPNEDRQKIQAASYGLRVGISAMQASLIETEGLGECAGEEEAEEECVHPQPVEALEQRTVGADYFKAIYVVNKEQIDEFVTLTGDDSATLEDLKAAYAKARPLYEQIETLAPAFPDEDGFIDARPDGYEFGELDPEFQGMHRIERMLYRDGITHGGNKFTTKTLNEWALQVQEVYVSLGTKIDALPGSVGSADVFDGVLGVMLEVAAKKISSEEETFSDLSLMIYHNNWLGGYSQILPFATLDGPESEANLTAAYEAAVACIAPHITGMAPECLPMTTAEDATMECTEALSTMTYASYRDLDLMSRECIVEEGMALREVMIDVANNLGVPHTCHNFHKDNVFTYRHATLQDGDAAAPRSTSIVAEGEAPGPAAVDTDRAIALASEEAEGEAETAEEGEGEESAAEEGAAEEGEAAGVTDNDASGGVKLATSAAVGAISLAAVLL